MLDFVKESVIINGSNTRHFQFFTHGFWIRPLPSYIDVVVSGATSLTLTNAVEDGLNYLKLFGGTEQRNIPSEYTQVDYVTNSAQTLLDTGVKFDFSKNYEIELRVRGVVDSWYILQARESSGSPISGISGSQTGNKISLSFNGNNVVASQISRVNGNIYYVKGTINNGTLTLYVKDETAGTEETVTGTYTPTTGQSVNIGLFGNLAGNYVNINSDVYFARIKEDDNYIIDYVPCKQTTTAGFYDKVSGTFKTTTDLVAGSDVTPTPTTPIDIVCNNGVLKTTRNVFDYKYFYDNYTVPLTSTVGRVAIQLSPNTNYTVSTNTQQSSTAAQVWTATGSDPNTFSPVTTTNGVLIDTPRTVQSDNNGYIILAIRVGTEYEIKESDFESGTVWVQIEQGSTATPYAPYSPNGIYTDGTVETVEVTGKNLFDTQWQTGIYSTASGDYTATANNRICNVNMIPVNSSTSYTVSCPSYSILTNMRWLFYDKNKNFISAITNGATTITTPSSAKYITFYIANNLTVDTAPDLQIEQGSTATTYEEYFNGGSATAEMLLKIGDYKDEQSVIDGGVTRNVGVKVLDGTENWAWSGTYSCPYINGAVSTLGMIANGTLYCSHNKFVEFAQINSNANCISSSTNHIYFKDSNYTTSDKLTDFTNWLADQYNAGTPVIIVYPLATATTETVTGQPLTVQTGTNTVTITQASIDGLEMEVSYKQQQ